MKPHTHWAVKYIGLKHVPGGRGPDAVDCWGLLQLIYREEFGIELPLLPGISAQATSIIAGVIRSHIDREWRQTEQPFDGCAVAMSQHNVIHHVGLYAEPDGGKIIHCWNGQAVIADTIRGLAFKGFQTIKFYEHKLWPTSSKSRTPLIPQPHVNIGQDQASLSVSGSGSSILGLLSSPTPLFA